MPGVQFLAGCGLAESFGNHSLVRLVVAQSVMVVHLADRDADGRQGRELVTHLDIRSSLPGTCSTQVGSVQKLSSLSAIRIAISEMDNHDALGDHEPHEAMVSEQFSESAPR